MTRRRPALIICLCLCPGPLACLEPPDLDELQAPLADLGASDSWGPLDPPAPSLDEDTGPSAPFGDLDGSASAVPDPALAQLRILEVLVDPDGKDGDVDSPEFVELLNAGPEQVELDGLVIEAQSWPTLDAAELGLLGVTLEPHGLLLVSRWVPEVDGALATLCVGRELVATGVLTAGGLRNADGVVRIAAGPDPIDELVYGSEPAEPGAGWPGAPVSKPSAGRSMCRSPEGADTDSAADWSECEPSPGRAAAPTMSETPDQPTGIAPGSIVIVEVAANPPGPASEEKPYEYIELLNISENDIELSGCRVGDDPSPMASGVDPLEHLGGDGGCASPTCLAPGRRALVVGQGYLGESGDALLLATDDSTIADGGLTNTEPVVLWDGLDTAVSSYRLWPDPSGEPTPSNELPLHRIDPDAPDEPASWVEAPPSPGN